MGRPCPFSRYAPSQSQAHNPATSVRAPWAARNRRGRPGSFGRRSSATIPFIRAISQRSSLFPRLRTGTVALLRLANPLFKEVLIHFLEVKGFLNATPDIVPDHEACQILAIHQHNALA